MADLPGDCWGRGALTSQSTIVIAGLVPATPIILHGRATVSGVAGTSPAMTTYFQ
jgi:hypothetical protein